jgi:hypothetical protein
MFSKPASRSELNAKVGNLEVRSRPFFPGQTLSIRDYSIPYSIEQPWEMRVFDRRKEISVQGFIPDYPAKLPDDL